MEMILRHDGAEWIAAGDDVEVRGSSLEELDSRLHDRLAESGALHHTKPVRVCMRFDMDGLPRRLHQYSSHYFNRVVSFSP